MNRIFHGLFEDHIKIIEDQSVDLVVTSPPYAEQRKNQYGGIAEADYPSWTVGWMAQIKRVLRPAGSVIINIRPHVINGSLSDYMLRTRLAIREDGWVECEELIWIKPDSPPMGHKFRHRRAWESLHWFSLTGSPYCDAKAAGSPSKRIGLESKKGIGIYIDGISDPVEGIARTRDYVEVGTHEVDKSPDNDHPAQFPVGVPEWLITTLCPPGGVVMDPFIGSGTTAVAAVLTGRKYIGIEKEETYVKTAESRLIRAEKEARRRFEEAKRLEALAIEEAKFRLELDDLIRF